MRLPNMEHLDTPIMSRATQMRSSPTAMVHHGPTSPSILPSKAQTVPIAAMVRNSPTVNSPA